MALKGTLKDFGIADILQLIGHQQKTGMLHLRNKDQEVHVGFRGGNIVKAESVFRKKKDLIGNMLVRADLITEMELASALETQKRTLERLGKILVDSGMLTAERFKQMVQLQTTETLYRLFSWKSGSYEFDQLEVEYDADAITPLRAESVLMEGFRMVDEWPQIQKRISDYQTTFQKLKELPEAPPQDAADDDDAGFDDAFGEEKTERKGEFKSVGKAERTIFKLINRSRTVRALIDQSCLGEFETCKALCNLINLEYLMPLPPVGRGESLFARDRFIDRASRKVGPGLLAALGASALALAVTRLDAETLGIGRSSQWTYSDPAAQRFISHQQMDRIQSALSVYLLEKGELPEHLEALVDTGLLQRDDLHHPWRDTYFYRRRGAGRFVLLPPLR